MTWYDGGLMPPTPGGTRGRDALVASGGILYVGTKGKLLCNEGCRRGCCPRACTTDGAPKEQLTRVPHRATR